MITTINCGSASWIHKYLNILQLDKVFDGKTIFIDWKTGIQQNIYARYSTPAGDPLIHMSPEPFFKPNYAGWAFHSFNPWKKKFDEILQQTIESGIIDHFKLKALFRMKQLASKEEASRHLERNANSALTLEDTQGIFYLALLVLVIAFLGFFFEQFQKIIFKPTTYYGRRPAFS